MLTEHKEKHTLQIIGDTGVAVEDTSEEVKQSACSS